MIHSLQGWLRPFAVSCVIGVLTCCAAVAQEVDPEEAKEKGIADRFVVVLEKNPRR